MANELQTKTSSPVTALTAMLNAETVKKQFANAIGKNADSFAASLIELTTSDANLQKCKPAALVTEALRAATLHLPLNKSLGYAYLVPFSNSVKNPDGSWGKVMTPTMIIGYKGLIQLALRTGQYKTINADVVYKGELRKVDKLSGTISFDGERESDEVEGYFCYFELLNGFAKTLYMSVGEMAAYAKKFSKGLGKDVTIDDLKALAGKVSSKQAVGWMGNFDEMALKTVTRRLIGKYGYLSIEMQNAISGDIQNDSMGQRNDIIADNANTKVINFDIVKFEKVDEQTGAIDEVEMTGAPSPNKPPRREVNEVQDMPEFTREY